MTARRDEQIYPLSFQTFGEFLRFLRKRARLSQRDLAAQVGYHYSYISRIENGQLTPDKAALEARFIPALDLCAQPEWGQRLIELASAPPDRHDFKHRTTSSQLPLSLTLILGRECETANLKKLILDERIRLITIVGAPGVGKTSLALHAAAELAHCFRQGVIFVDLVSVTLPEHVLPALAAALGLQVSAAASPVDDLVTALQNRHQLIVVDNFEQVLEAAPELMPLLRSAPELKILSTSREALRLPGEYEFPLAPLPLPDESMQDVDRLKGYHAVQLFFERARAIKPDFELNADNTAYVAQICRRLDGLPLAIELAAARIRTLGLSAMLEQLDQRYEWLTRGGRDLPAWRQTLWGTVEWSYNLLTEPESSLFRWLAVFAGGWTQEAARAVFYSRKDPDAHNFTGLLMQLADKSLLVADVTERRYHFLETLREFALEKLKTSGELEIAQQKHYEYYLKFAQTAYPHILKGSNQLLWLERMEREHNNLRAALGWASASTARANLAMELGSLIHPFWLARSHIREAREWLERILALDPTPSMRRANLLRFASDYAGSQGDYQNARRLEEEGQEISKALGDDVGMYSSMAGLAVLVGIQGDYARAAELLEQVLVYRRQTHDSTTLTTTLNNLALASRRLGKLDHARELYTESINSAEHSGSLISLAHALNGLAEVLAELQDYAAAIVLQRRSIAIRYQLGNLKGLYFSISALATLKDQFGESHLAVLLNSASLKIRQDLGLSISLASQAENEIFLAQLREKLSEADFKDAWENGQNLPLAQVVTLALEDASE
jgi:predicted ATPase/DNA-binding XRE family transcriptional regulator